MFRATLAALLVSLISLASAAPRCPAEEKDLTQRDREKQFAERFDGVQMKGQFTIDGKAGPPKEETYTIEKVTRLDIDDLWRFDVHMKYGDVDRKVALAVPVKWAGDTPVISLDKTAIPNLGTFSAKVVIDGDKYAGTWAHHGAGGGHMFGVLEKVKKQ